MSRRERTVLEHAENEEGCDDDDDGVVAYLTMPDHPGPGATAAKTLRLRDLVGDYTGPDPYFDFDASNVLLGVEILD